VADIAADMLRCPRHLGYTHGDLLRLAHPKPETPARNALFQWVVEGRLGHLATPEIRRGELRQVYAVERLRATDDEREALTLIEQYSLTAAMVPAEWKHSPAVWETLIEKMNSADLVRNLTWLADSGLLVGENPAAALVVARLMDLRRLRGTTIDPEELARARDAYGRHPRALRVVVDALDEAMTMANV
jgi:60 kDa SS-A/Ro ribonucleoprotein